jgi:hypothetical protein
MGELSSKGDKSIIAEIGERTHDPKENCLQSALWLLGDPVGPIRRQKSDGGLGNQPT